MPDTRSQELGRLYQGDLPRGIHAIPCECGGYCDLVRCNEAECTKYGCGRDTPPRRCCAVAFVCRICGMRWAGTQDSPES